MSQPEERRRHPRYEVGHLPGRLDGGQPFETLKLSAGGMLLRTARELSLGERVEVELLLGGERFASAAHVVFTGPDASSRTTATPLYRIGLAFQDTASAYSALLRRFIAEELSPQPPTHHG